MTFRKKITTVNPDGSTLTGRAAVVAEDDVERSKEETHNRLSRQAQLDATIQTVEETANGLVVVYSYGRVEVHQWIEEGRDNDHHDQHLADRNV